MKYSVDVGSDPADQSTKPLISPVNYTKELKLEKEIGSKPSTTTGNYQLGIIL